jgi:hypothetical protein
MTLEELNAVSYGKFLYRLPDDYDRNWLKHNSTKRGGMYAIKQNILKIKQTFLNHSFGDRRHLHNISQHTNPKGHTFLYGDYGIGKNCTKITIGQIFDGKWLIMNLN